MFALPVCISPATYRIDITPQAANDIFGMELNATATFKVTAYEKKEDATIETEVNLDKLWWNFDKQILLKVNSTSTSVTLKATKSGVSKLTATAMIQNHSCTKTITILVREIASVPVITKPPKKKR
jgi:hypothetical protein